MRLADDLRQELVHDEPLVVPGRQPPRLGEDRRRVVRCPLRAHVVDGVVVEEQERAVQAGDDQVLVVARVGDRSAAPSARRGRSSNSPPLSTFSLMWSSGSYSSCCGDRARAVDRVEVERRRAEVARVLGLGRPGRAASRRRRSCRGRGTGRRTSCRPCASGCSGCSRSATGRRSAPSAPPTSGSAASSRPPGLPELDQRGLRPPASATANGGRSKIRPK